MGLLNSGFRVNESVENSVSLFVIGYPRKKGKPAPLGPDIIKNILKSGNVIVDVDNTLSLMDKAATVKILNKLKDALNTANIQFEHRVTEAEVSNPGLLTKLFSMPKKTGNREFFTFELDSRFNDENLLNIMVNIGCEIFVPFEFSEGLVQEVFNGNFQDRGKRFSAFKYVIFISDYLGQAALRTKTIKMEDVQNLLKIEERK
jgi:hypothetical protein